MRGHTSARHILTLSPPPPMDIYVYRVFGARDYAHCLHTVAVTCTTNQRVTRRSFRGRDARSHALTWAKQDAAGRIATLQEIRAAPPADARYWRTVITVEVLSDSRPEFESLAEVAEEIVDGDHSGRWHVASQEAVSAEVMAELLQAQGSDPAFLLGADWDTNEAANE